MCFHGTYQRHRSGHSLTGNTSPKVSHSCSHSTKQQRNFVAVSSSRVGRCLTCRSASRPGSACSLHSLSEDWCIYSRACCFTERLSERAASLEVYKHNRKQEAGPRLPAQKCGSSNRAASRDTDTHRAAVCYLLQR